jgi:predicted  nucleic acid-binding Zn-ribbon protein
MLLTTIDFSVTKELVGIFTLAIAGVSIIVRLNSRLDKLEFRSETMEEMIKQDRERMQRMFEKLNGDIIHLEKNISQMQTNLRIFISEQGRETTEHLEKLLNKIESLKDDHNAHKLEISKQINNFK